MLRRVFIGLLSVISFVRADCVSAQTLPLDKDRFTAYIAEEIRGNPPEGVQVRVVVPRPLLLRLQAPSGMSVEANLTEFYNHCVALEGRCAEAKEGLIQNAFQALGEVSRPVAADDLRVVVRSESYVAESNDTLKRHGLPPIIAKPYVGDLWMVLAFSRSQLIGVANSETIKALGLEEAAAFAIALRNTREERKPILERSVPLRGTYLHILGEDSYESSRMLLHDDWAEVAARNGDLVVSVPAANSVIFGKGKTAEQIKAMREVVSKQARTALQPLSAQLFRWRPNGWEVVEEKGEPRAEANLPAREIRSDTVRRE